MTGPGPAPDPCPYAGDDAAFVLGALDPAEQRAYRAHLAGCPACASAVTGLADLPGMLARLLADEAAVPEPVPAPVLPALLDRVRAERRTTLWKARITGFLAAAVLAAGGFFLALPQPATPDREIAMAAAPGVDVRATLFVTDRGWGTTIETRCSYADGVTPPPEVQRDPTYYLYAIDGEGQEVLVSSWEQRGGTEVTIPGSTGLAFDDISRLEVRTASGVPILYTQP